MADNARAKEEFKKMDQRGKRMLVIAIGAAVILGVIAIVLIWRPWEGDNDRVEVRGSASGALEEDEKEEVAGNYVFERLEAV